LDVSSLTPARPGCAGVFFCYNHFMDLPLYLGAFVAGILMFLAPCTLPIVPGYLAFIAGVPAGQAGSRRRIFINALAFVIGFSVIFILLGTFAAALGALAGPLAPAYCKGGRGYHSALWADDAGAF
jgi:cytochrome c biogenesis protein CcdA